MRIASSVILAGCQIFSMFTLLISVFSLTPHSGMAFLDVVMLAAVLLTLVRGLTLP